MQQGQSLARPLFVELVRYHGNQHPTFFSENTIMHSPLLLWTTSLLILHGSLGRLTAQQDDPLPGNVTEQHLMVPMRDGVRLSVYLYIPEGDGPWPALLEQRYASARAQRTREEFAKLAAHGYVVALQNFRGTQLSEGRYVGYRALGWGRQRDGYDTVEWLAKQSWCSGKVGTFGSSQAGYAQNFLAVTQPPHLVCQYMIDTGLSLYQEGYRIGGTTRPERFKGMAAVCRDPADNQLMLEEWFQHPTYDRYWKDEDCSRHFNKMNVPCMTIGSWYDFMCQGSVESYIGRQHSGGPNSRGTQKLLVGPWLHGRFNKGNRVGELEYPSNADFDMMTHMLQWFDHYLKDVDNGADSQATVQYYKMGAVGEEGSPGNAWQSVNDWPVAATDTHYYLSPAAQLSTSRPSTSEGGTSYVADPLSPAEIPGRGFPGARDARGFEQQDNVLTFTTDVLASPLEWTGHVRANLFVTSTAPDSDFIVRISDVYPDGRSILIADYIRRGRYREGFHKEVFMKPGRVYNIRFHVGWMSQVFAAGHRIRVTVASTGAPFYEPNPNTAAPLTIDFPADEETLKATNTILHNRRHASHVIAPVVD
jgi:predicted acyl esterase